MTTHNKCERITGYLYEHSRTTAILNVMAKELRSIYKSHKTFDNVHLLHKKNIKAFKKLWGKQSCCWQGEYRHWIWMHEFPNTLLFVLTSNKGTSYEVARIDDNDNWDATIKETKEFIGNLLKELEPMGPLHE